MTVKDTQDHILNYLTIQNRPYSAIDIVNNLKGEIPKSQVLKMLAALQDAGSISVKLNGKQQVFVVNQENQDGIDKEQMQQMDEQIEALKLESEQKRDVVREKASRLATLTSALTTQDVKARIEHLQEENQSARQRLLKLKEGTVIMSDQDRQKMEAEFELMSKEHRKRVKMYKSIMDTVTESGDMKAKDLEEELGIELD